MILKQLHYTQRRPSPTSGQMELTNLGFGSLGPTSKGLKETGVAIDYVIL
jgi:hypothetical protein